MSMSMSLSFFRNPEDPDLSKKLDAAYACEKAGVDLSQELKDYLAPVFEECGEEALPKNRDDAIDAMLSLGPLHRDMDAYTWSDDMMEGFEINLDTLPKGTKRVRFYCSW